MTPQRMLELATERADQLHTEAMGGEDGYAPSGHEGDFDTCPHATCLGVREAAARQEAPPERWLYAGETHGFIVPWLNGPGHISGGVLWSNGDPQAFELDVHDGDEFLIKWTPTGMTITPIP